jgi:hypothetical protein
MDSEVIAEMLLHRAGKIGVDAEVACVRSVAGERPTRPMHAHKLIFIELDTSWLGEPASTTGSVGVMSTLATPASKVPFGLAAENWQMKTTKSSVSDFMRDQRRRIWA